MKHQLYILISLIIIGFASCADEIPNIYEPEYFVEAYLIVGEPIQNIILMKSQPLADSFSYSSSLISDAEEVKISSGDNDFILDFKDDSIPGYYYHDENYLVLPQTEYKLRITLKDGTIITGSTYTPSEFAWVKPLKEQVQYPKDSINLPEDESLKIEWDSSSSPLEKYYLIRSKCLDTTYYGKYLKPPAAEYNRRVYKPYGHNSRYYNDVNMYFGPLPNTKTVFVWSVLKWFGVYELSVYRPDINYLAWFIQMQRESFYNPRLGTIEGAIGVFGSASVIKDTTFIIKNQK